jgi:hypothetical protein
MANHSTVVIGCRQVQRAPILRHQQVTIPFLITSNMRAKKLFPRRSIGFKGDDSIVLAGEGAQHQPGQCLLPASSGVRRRPRNHAPSRPTASGVPLCREPDVARPVGCRGAQDRPSSREDADEADGDRGSIAVRVRRSPSRATRSTRICCEGWRSRGRTRCGRWTSPTFRWHVASSILPSCSRLGEPPSFCRGGCPSSSDFIRGWKRHSVSRRWGMPWPITASRQFGEASRRCSG